MVAYYKLFKSYFNSKIITMSFQLNTLHIFSFGKVQVIGQQDGKPFSKTAPLANLTKAQPVVDMLYAKKPVDNDSLNEYHAINVFNNMFADYLPSGEKKAWRTKWNDLDSTKVQDLVNEVLA